MRIIIKNLYPLRSLLYATATPLGRNVHIRRLVLNSVRGFAELKDQKHAGSKVRKIPIDKWSSLRDFRDTQRSLKSRSEPRWKKPKGHNVFTQFPGIEPMVFPAFWLRDNCQCAQCIHPDTRQRIVDTFSIPLNVNAVNIENDGVQLSINWSDGHTGIYPKEWLVPHRYNPRIWPGEKNTIRFRIYDAIPSNHTSLPTVSYEEVMDKEVSVLEWLDKIHRFGFCMVEGVPVDPSSTQKLLERISFIRPTHYGGFWDFTANLRFKDTAYTSEGLGAHTDNTYFTDPARLQLFHMLSHIEGEGGSSLLVDGFRAAEVLLRESRKHALALKRLKQPSHASGNEDVSIQPHNAAAVFQCHNETNELFQIRWNNYDRAAKVDWDIIDQEGWYEAASHWNKIIRSPEMEIWIQLQPGTALIFDNWRMLHGRSPFTGKRRLCGGYINNDDLMSRHHLLKYGRQHVLNHLGIPRHFLGL